VAAERCPGTLNDGACRFTVIVEGLWRAAYATGGAGSIYQFDVVSGAADFDPLGNPAKQDNRL
jgi:hypothetical protein